MKTILNTNELSDYIGISKTTIWRLRKNNQIPFFKIGKRVFFNKGAIDKWIADGGTGGNAWESQ